MLEGIIITCLALWFILVLGHVFGPYHTYSSGSDHIGLPHKIGFSGIPQEPDLRLAHWSQAERDAHLAKLREKEHLKTAQRYAQLEKQMWEEAHERRRKNYLARREAAWKNGTPDVSTEEVPEVRRTGRARPMPRMPQEYYRRYPEARRAEQDYYYDE